MRSLYQIVIPKRNSGCQVCKTQFQSQAEIVSQLIAGEEWQRLDFCEKCYTPQNCIVWKSRIPAKEVEERDDRAMLEKAWELLLELSASTKIEEQEEAFMLALYLNRKKVLAQRKEKIEHENRFWCLYEHLESSEMLLVPKVDPLKLPIPAVQKRLQHKLYA